MFPGLFVVFVLPPGLLTDVVFPLGLLFPVLVVTGGFLLLVTMLLLELDDDGPLLPVTILLFVEEVGLFVTLPDEDVVPPGLLELLDPPTGLFDEDVVPPGLLELLDPPTGLFVELVVPLGLLELLLPDPDDGLSVEEVGGFLRGGFLNEGNFIFNA